MALRPDELRMVERIAAEAANAAGAGTGAVNLQPVLDDMKALRGELKTLRDGLKTLGDGLQTLRGDVASITTRLNQVLQRVVAVENAMLPKDSGGHPPKLDMGGAEQFLALGWDGMVAYAKANSIDISVVTGHDEQMLAEFLAAATNLLGGG